MENNNNSWFCPKCGTANNGRFCAKCGTPKPESLNQPAPQAEPIKPSVQIQPQPRYDSYDNAEKKPSNTGKFFAIGILLAILVGGGIGFGLYKAGMIGGNEAKQAAVQTSSQTSPSSAQPVQKAQTDKADKADSANKGPMTGPDLTLGGVMLGSTLSNVHQTLGRENSSEITKEGSTCYHYDHMQVFVKDGTVVGLVSEDSSVKTKRGIGQGDPADAVFERYGKDYYITEYDGKNLYEYTYAGKGLSGILRFAVNKSDNNVSYVSIRLNN